MAYEEIDHDNFSTGTANAATSLTKSHVTTGSSLVLICAIRLRNSSADTVTGVTYDSVALTRLATNANTSHRNYL